MDQTEVTAIRERLATRVPPRWDGVTIQNGWLPIVDRLDRALAEIDPNYQIHQVKEKFGGLRYYATGENFDNGGGWLLIQDAEALAAHTCERCGMHSDDEQEVWADTDGSHWILTLCREHHAARLDEAVKQESDTPE